MDVSRIQDLPALFSSLRNIATQCLNENITRWNVSSARNMSEMFFGAFSFHGEKICL
jgi:Mycoplasma protein of unknown function, DUF285